MGKMGGREGSKARQPVVGACISRGPMHNVAAVAPYHVMLDKGQWREKLCHWLHKHVLFVSPSFNIQPHTHEIKYPSFLGVT